MSTVTQLSYEIETATAFLEHGPSKQLAKFSRTMGLESATILSGYVDISEEGVVNWISDKFKALQHKFHIFVNEVYAKLTKSSDEVKKAINDAKAHGPDHGHKLPVTKTGMYVGAAAILASAAALMLLAGKIRGSKADKAPVAHHPEPAVGGNPKATPRKDVPEPHKPEEPKPKSPKPHETVDDKAGVAPITAAQETVHASAKLVEAVKEVEKVVAHAEPEAAKEVASAEREIKTRFKEAQIIYNRVSSAVRASKSSRMG